MKSLTLLSILISLNLVALTSATPVVFPTPSSLEENKGEFRLSQTLDIELKGIAEDRQNTVKSLFNFLKYKSSNSTNKSSLTVEINASFDIPKEGYKLIISPGQILIEASSETGIFYAVQTLKQLKFPVYNQFSLPTLEITDSPRFGWRGMHLDVSRHFYDVDFIKRYLDLMALYKLNYFHWHLSDDDGWRLESKKYSKLTKLGSNGSRSGANKGGGFYTHEQVKEIIAYAKDRHITVVPEIDVPGHSAAIIKAYPELGSSHDVLNIGKPETIDFLENLFTEVAQLFPTKYVHIGCDEVGRNAWKKNKDCIAKMKSLGLKDTQEFHRWLVHHLQSHLAKQSKQSIAWCEVLDCDVKSDVIVMCWRDNGGWIKAPKKGHKIIVTPSMQAYFNYQEDIGSNAPGHGGYRTTLKKVYHFDPIDKSLTEKQRELVLGGQGCIWTEYIRTPDEIEYILFPRAIALSEALWSPLKKKDWNGFQTKLKQHRRYLQKHDINYRVAAPIAKNKKVRFTDQTTVKLENPDNVGNIYYTKDGTTPTRNSLLYKDGILVRENCTIKALIISDLDKPSYQIEVSCIQKKSDPNHAKLAKLVSFDTNMATNGQNRAVNTFDADEETIFWSSHGVTTKHHFTMKFAKAVSIKEIKIQTGRNGRDILKAGDLQVSYDGENFVKLADFTGGVASGTPKKAIKAVRIKVLRDQNEWLIIRDIELN